MPLRRSQHNGLSKSELDTFLRHEGPESITISANQRSPGKSSAASTMSWSVASSKGGNSRSPNSVISNDIPRVGSRSSKNSKRSSNQRLFDVPEQQHHQQQQHHSVSSLLKYQQQAENDSLLRVQVESAAQRTTFYVPVSLMLQREMEMQDAAQKSDIDSSRWSNSRLFSQWKEQQQMVSKKHNEEITLHLAPEESMKEFSALAWKPWLTTCVRAYYNTGTIRIPDDCLGPDILLALEYFGILTTSPDAFVFDSYPAYERIKVWSAYFTHRNVIIDWVSHDYRVRGGGCRTWVACVESEETRHSQTLLQVQGERAGVLWGEESNIDNWQLSCRSVYELFSDKESESILTREMPERMRKDFCQHVERSLLNEVVATFDIELVKITTSSGQCITEMRPTLRLQPIGGNGRDGQPSMGLSSCSGTKDSTGSDLARMIGMQENASAVSILKQSQSGALGSTGGRLSFSSSPSSRGSKHRLHSTPTRSTAMDSIEQRHPNRSSPEPDERRSSPELRKTISGPLKQQQQQVSDIDFMDQLDAVAPVKIINTAFGDMGSVTSGLTGPFGDESTIADLPTLRSNARNRNVLPLNDTLMKLKEEEDQDEDIPVVPIERAMDFESKQEEERAGEKPVNQNYRARAKRSTNSNSFDYWERFLVNVCEAVIPSGTPERATSPVRSVTIPTTSGTETNSMQDATDRTRPPLAGATKKMKSRIAKGMYKPTHEIDGDNVLNCDSHESSIVVDGARKVGDNLTKQIDEFMRLALDTIEPETAEERASPKPRQPAKLPDKLPMPQKKKSIPQSASNTSSNSRGKAQVRRNANGYHDGIQGHGNGHPDLFVTKGSRNGSGGRESFPSTSGSSTPKRQERRAASSFSPLEKNITLPPREPRRVRSKQNFAIARKKNSAQTMPPRHPAQQGAGVLPVSASYNSAKSLSTAQVKNTKPDDGSTSSPSSEPILHKRPNNNDRQTATPSPTLSAKEDTIVSVPSAAPSTDSSNTKGSRRLFSFRRKK